MSRMTVGMLANRDPELISELKAEFGRMDIASVDLDTRGPGSSLSSLDKGMSVILPKLLTDRENTVLFRRLRQTGNRFLNSLDSVDVCQSRRRMFGLVQRELPDIRIPETFRDAEEALDALRGGRTVWVRRDAHNIPKESRVLGKADSAGQLLDMVKGLDEEELFFQEYLGTTEEVFKAYVIGDSIHCLRKKGLQDGFKPDVDLGTDMIEVGDVEKKMILELGRAFGMSVYGVDFIYRDGKPVVVDVNDFPSFRGIPDAARNICEFVYRNFSHDGR